MSICTKRLKISAFFIIGKTASKVKLQSYFCKVSPSYFISPQSSYSGRGYLKSQTLCELYEYKSIKSFLPPTPPPPLPFSLRPNQYGTIHWTHGQIASLFVSTKYQPLNNEPYLYFLFQWNTLTCLYFALLHGLVFPFRVPLMDMLLVILYFSWPATNISKVCIFQIFFE